MQRILTSEEMREADTRAFNEGRLDSRAVMEVAGWQVASVILAQCGLELAGGAVVLCGRGNNGGDGYVVARVLHTAGVALRVFSSVARDELDGDCAKAHDAFIAAGGDVVLLDESREQFFECLANSSVFVDALFGTGLHGPLRQPFSDLVQGLNSVCARHAILVVAIDVPSGIDASKSECVGVAVRADITIALQALKIAHVQLPNLETCGEIYCVDIGVSVADAPYRILLSEEYVCRHSRTALSLASDTHKGRRGFVQVLGGSPGYFGAPQLSAKAATHSGAGVVELLLPQSIAHQVGAHCGELLCRGLRSDEHGVLLAEAASQIPEVLSRGDVLVIGPGMGTEAGSLAVLKASLSYCATLGMRPVVLDADALTLLAANESLNEFIDSHCILTPHPGEMSRLLGNSTQDVQKDRFAAVSACAQKYSAWVLLKGAYSLLASPDGKVFVNPVATAALAVAGSGDVLAGCLAGLAARDGDWEGSATLGMFAHGVAGALLAQSSGTVFASSALRLIESLPVVLGTIAQREIAPSSLVQRCLPFQILDEELLCAS